MFFIEFYLVYGYMFWHYDLCFTIWRIFYYVPFYVWNSNHYRKIDIAVSVLGVLFIIQLEIILILEDQMFCVKVLLLF